MRIMKKMNLFKKAPAFICGAIAIVMMTACGKEAVTEDVKDAQVNEDAVDESSAAVETESQSRNPFDATGIEGEWVMVYSVYDSDYDSGEKYSSVTMATDEYSPESQINIYKKDGKYTADYKYIGYESDTRYYGNELVYIDEPAYEDYKNSDWCFTFTDPFGDMLNPKRFTMEDESTLISTSEYTDEGEDYRYHSVNRDVYLRSDDPRLENPEELRYFDTVTVSDVEGLFKNIRNNRKIILKGGTYDFSSVDEDKVINEFVSCDWGGYRISNVYNTCIEAAEGEDVQFSVDDPYSAVITFYGCGNITLRGITAGHNVEPGYCSGSVVNLEQTYGMDIDSCKLYGCGTYGVSALNSDRINVTDSEIYECSYGLVDLNQVYRAKFTGCTFRDSKDLSMINAYSCTDISFDDCIFKNNYVNPINTYCFFVDMSEYTDVTFNECTFENNQYNMFSNNKVKMNNCRVSDNGDMSNVETEEDADASELRRRYKETCDEQEQIALKFAAGNMDQATMNQTAYEEYSMWDTLINDIWAYMKATIDEAAMEDITAGQLEWIDEKEAAVKSAGAAYEGGTIQPMVEYETGAKYTRERVEYLLENYVQ